MEEAAKSAQDGKQHIQVVELCEEGVTSVEGII